MESAGRRFRARWQEFEEKHGHHREHRQQETEDFSRPDPYGKGTCNVQVLRSVSDWSHGVLVEHSIQNAYIQLIREANHFIYIGEDCRARAVCTRIADEEPH